MMVRKDKVSMINIFDMMGPVMVGPSSSHTAGAARIGNMGRTLLGEEVARADIGLYGSFAETATIVKRATATARTARFWRDFSA